MEFEINNQFIQGSAKAHTLAHALGHELAGPAYCPKGASITVTLHLDTLGKPQMHIHFDGNVDGELASLMLEGALQSVRKEGAGG